MGHSDVVADVTCTKDDLLALSSISLHRFIPDCLVAGLFFGRYSMLGRVEDPANELLNGDVYMTNSKRDPASPQSTAAQSTSSNNHIHRRSVFCAGFLKPITSMKSRETVVFEFTAREKKSKEKYIQK